MREPKSLLVLNLVSLYFFTLVVPQQRHWPEEASLIRAWCLGHPARNRGKVSGLRRLFTYATRQMAIDSCRVTLIAPSNLQHAEAIRPNKPDNPVILVYASTMSLPTSVECFTFSIPTFSSGLGSKYLKVPALSATKSATYSLLGATSPESTPYSVMTNLW